jgi:hypothetical protein
LGNGGKPLQNLTPGQFDQFLIYSFISIFFNKLDELISSFCGFLQFIWLFCLTRELRPQGVHKKVSGY